MWLARTCRTACQCNHNSGRPNDHVFAAGCCLTPSVGHLQATAKLFSFVPDDCAVADRHKAAVTDTDAPACRHHDVPIYGCVQRTAFRMQLMLTFPCNERTVPIPISVSNQDQRQSQSHNISNNTNSDTNTKFRTVYQSMTRRFPK